MTNFANLDFKIDSDSIEQFVDYWSRQYKYSPPEKLYVLNIGKPLTEQSIMELFEWKNGMPLSESKKDSIKLNYKPEFTGNVEERYLNHKQPGGAIWNIFYLHCLDNNKWPIFDQHCYRAMMYIKERKIQKLQNNAEKYYFYKNSYIDFFQSAACLAEPRKVDKALFAFGKFLKCVEDHVEQS